MNTPDTLITCGRCSKMVILGEAESCWWCLKPLCSECWDKYGHCGHHEAEWANLGVWFTYTGDVPLAELEPETKEAIAAMMEAVVKAIRDGKL